MAKIADLIIQLSADIGTFRTGMEEANSHLQKMRSQSDDAGRALTSLKTMAEGVISVAAIERLGSFVESTLRMADVTGQTAAAMGISSEAFQVLGLAAQKANIDQATFSAGLGHLAQAIALAEHGGATPAASAFAKLKISLTDAHGEMLPLDNVLQQVANSLIHVQSGTERTAIAQEFFGRSGRLLLPVLSDVAGQGFQRMREEAQKLGIVLSEDDLKASTDLSSQFTIMARVLQTDALRAILAFAPELKALGDEFVDASKNVRLFFDNFTTPANVQGLTESQLEKAIESRKATIANLQADLAKAGSAAGAAPGSKIFNWIDELTGLPSDPLTQLGRNIQQVTRELHDYQAALDAMRAKGASGGMGAPFADPAASKALKDYQNALDELTRSFDIDREHQQMLLAAYGQGNDEVRQAQVQIAGETAVQKLLNDAKKAAVQVTAEQISEVYAKATADERSKQITQDQINLNQKLAQTMPSYTEQLAKARAAAQALLDPQQKLEQTLGDLEQLLKRGDISFQEYAVASKQAADSIKKTDDESKKLAQEIGGAVRQGASRFLDAMTQIGTSKSIVTDLGNAFLGLAQDIEKAILDVLILEPLIEGLKAEMQASGGFSGLFGDFLSWFGGGGGGMGPPTPSTYGPAYASGGDFVVGGTGGIDSQLVRFAATPGEQVSVRTPGSGRSGTPVVNNTYIVNNSSAHASRGAERGNGTGGTDLIVQIEDAIASRVRRGQGNLSRALEASYPLTRTPVAR
jgi:hypothetical protein